MLELLDIAAGDPSVEISSFDYCADKGSFVPLKITKFVQVCDMASHRKEHKEMQILESLRSINAISVHAFRVAVQVRDVL